MTHDVIVIGGGPAGLSAAQNVRARGRTVLVVSNPLEENPLWKAERVDNYLGLPAVSGAELLTAFRRHGEAAGADFQEGRVLSALRSGEDWYVSIGNTMAQAKAVVLAAGVARGRKFPGEAELLGRGVSRRFCGASAARFSTSTSPGTAPSKARRRWNPSPATARRRRWRACSSCGPPWPRGTCSRALWRRGAL